MYPEYGITPSSEFDEIKKKPSGAPKKDGGRSGGQPSLLSRVFGGKRAPRKDWSGESTWKNEPGKLTAYLPAEDDWWRLYINPADHAEAQSKKPDAPGTFYDSDESPGYQQGMVEAYRRFLNTDSTEEIGHEEYFAMRDTATEHLSDSRREGARKPAEGQFPLSTDPLNPSRKDPRKPPPKVAADLKKEKLGDHYVIDDSGRNNDAPRGSTNYLTRTQPYAIGALKYKYIYPAYGSKFDHSEGEEAFVAKNTPEVAKLVDAAMARYEEEAAAAPDDYESVLKAIARAVRVLHVVHPFEDGNGRLNIHLLLPRLLLRHGFPPVVPENMSVLFNGTFTADEIVDHLKTALEKGPKRAE